MTQIAIIQAAPQSTPTVPTLTQNKPNHFFPHLEKAVTETTQADSDAISENVIPAINQSFIDSSPSETAEHDLDTPHLADIKLNAAADHIEEGFIEALTMGNPADAENAKLVTAEKELLPIFQRIKQKNLVLQNSGQEISAQPASHVLTRQSPGQEIAMQHAGHGLTLHPPGQEVAAQAGGRKISTEVANKVFHLLDQGKSSGVSDTPLKIDIAAAMPQDKNNPLPPPTQNQTVLQQLQQIISNANETGTISIRVTGNNDSLQYRGEAGTEPGNILSSQIVEQSKVAEKQASQIPTLRQDMLAQYFDAKVNTREPSDSGSNTQSSDQQNNANSQQTSTTPQVNSSLSPEQSSSFQNVSTLMQDLQTGQTQNGVKSVILPSGTVVNEENVMQQIVERFQINNRANDIKISLKLHPEELGELKIDLTLKEGSIKANVIAHSQHVQEIIEKNMIKLRNVLENQGFTIEEIVVTSESDSVPDFDLFEQHLPQQNDFSPHVAETRNHNDFDIALEDAVEQSVESTTGVNIQA